MKALAIFFLMITFIQVAHAHKRIVMLTSLALSESKVKKAEKIFYRYFPENEFNSSIYHSAGPALLGQVMNDPDNEVIIWVSHSAQETTYHPGISARGVILDQHGNDIKNFFTTPTTSLRFLGVVGCEAQNILEGFKEKGHYKQLPALEFMSFTKKTKLLSGLKKVLQKAAEHLKTSPTTEIKENTPPSETLEIEILAPYVSAGGWIELGDMVLSYVKKSDFPQRLILEMSKERFTQMKNKNIRYIRDRMDKNSTQLNELSIAEFGHNMTWKIFSDKSGKAIGPHHQQLYIYHSSTKPNEVIL